MWPTQPARYEKGRRLPALRRWSPQPITDHDTRSALSGLHLGIERVNARERSLAERKGPNRGDYIRSRERPAYAALRNTEGVKRKHVVVRNLVVPRRARPVVAEIVARHVLVRGEPLRVIVDS